MARIEFVTAGRQFESARRPQCSRNKSARQPWFTACVTASCAHTCAHGSEKRASNEPSPLGGSANTRRPFTSRRLGIWTRFGTRDSTSLGFTTRLRWRVAYGGWPLVQAVMEQAGDVVGSIGACRLGSRAGSAGCPGCARPVDPRLRRGLASSSCSRSGTWSSSLASDL
jgi:hypothetical protein